MKLEKPQVRLCVTQTRPVVRRLGFSSEQRPQFALLVGNKHTDHLPAHLRHADPAHISNTLQPDQHRRRHVKLHGELTAGTILGRQPRTNDHQMI